MDHHQPTDWLSTCVMCTSNIHSNGLGFNTIWLYRVYVIELWHTLGLHYSYWDLMFNDWFNANNAVNIYGKDSERWKHQTTLHKLLTIRIIVQLGLETYTYIHFVSPILKLALINKSTYDLEHCERPRGFACKGSD